MTNDNVQPNDIIDSYDGDYTFGTRSTVISRVFVTTLLLATANRLGVPLLLRVIHTAAAEEEIGHEHFHAGQDRQHHGLL